MACSGAYATAYDFSSSWCQAAILTGFDDSVGVGHAFLTDTTRQFTHHVGLEVGSPLFNVTKGTYGKVTSITDTILGTTNVWDSGDEYNLLTSRAAEVATIEHYLDIASSDIHIALAATGACDCTPAGWATAPRTGLLRKLNVIDAAVIHHCPCGSPGIPDDRWPLWMQWTIDTLEALRTGNLEICDGATAASWPTIGWGQQAFTDRQAARLIYNRMLREG